MCESFVFAKRNLSAWQFKVQKTMGYLKVLTYSISVRLIPTKYPRSWYKKESYVGRVVGSFKTSSSCCILGCCSRWCVGQDLRWLSFLFMRETCFKTCSDLIFLDFSGSWSLSWLLSWAYKLKRYLISKAMWSGFESGSGGSWWLAKSSSTRGAVRL